MCLSHLLISNLPDVDNIDLIPSIYYCSCLFLFFVNNSIVCLTKAHSFPHINLDFPQVDSAFFGGQFEELQ